MSQKGANYIEITPLVTGSEMVQKGYRPSCRVNMNKCQHGGVFSV